jgi:hypothetical protein
MGHNYTDKNWRVSYYDLPHDERHTPQDCMPHEERFGNYDDAERRATELESDDKDAVQVKITIWDGDCCIDEMINAETWRRWTEDKH